MRIPHGKRIDYEDDVVVVYNERNEIVYKGTVDYCPYKDEPYTSHTIETVATAATHLNNEEYEKLIQITNPF